MKHYNPILHGSSRAWAEQGRHYIGGGIGEAALIGAAVGGGTALITGEDPLQGALTGGVLGGAGGALFGTGAQGAKTATEVATKAPSVAGVVGQGVNLSNAASPLFYSGAGTGVGTGIGSGVGSGITAAAQGVGQAVPSAVAQGLYPNFATAGQGVASTAAGLTDDVIAAAGKDVAAGIAGAPQMASAGQPGMFDSLGSFYSNLSTPGKIGLGIAGGVGLNALTGQRPGVPKLDDGYDGPLSRFNYDPDKFSPTRVTSNIYRPSYAAVGGVMKSYAQGGIAALANGGMGGNTGYPMGQMDMTQYATPTQMPTSAQIVNSDYAQKTDPYLGTPIGMAEGGAADGGKSSTSSNYSLGDSLGLLQTTNPDIAAMYMNPAPVQQMAAVEPMMAETASLPAPVQTPMYTKHEGMLYGDDFYDRYAQNRGGQYADPYHNFLMTSAKVIGPDSDIPKLLEQYRASGRTDTPDWATVDTTGPISVIPKLAHSWDASGANPVDRLSSAWNPTTPLAEGVTVPEGYWDAMLAYNMNLSKAHPDLFKPEDYASGRVKDYNDTALFALRNNILDINDPKVAAYEMQKAAARQYEGAVGSMEVGALQRAYADYMRGLQSNTTMPGYAEGGIAGYNLGGYASGGNPRLLKGPGDGMSDNIPATIGDRQPARLADGEFVVPADVVSHLGNGSTDAGAKHLYRMMDKVRKARTGNKKQGKKIKPEKYLPA